MKRIVLLLVMLAGVLGCTIPQTSSLPTVLVFGDSLTVLSESAAIHADPKEHLIFQAEGGTGMCDWANGAAEDRALFRPTRVVLAFTGNVSNCALAGYEANRLTGVVGVYQTALRTFAAAFKGLPVTVLAPVAMNNTMRGYAGWYPYNGNPAFGAMYQMVSAQLGLHYSTVADDTLTPGHVFRWQAPSYGGGPNVFVRAPDGIHLTPAGEVYYGVALVS